MVWEIAMDFKSNETIYSQIIEYIRKQIFSGSYGSGTRLPAIRDLAVKCKVNPNTIVRVYAELSEEKLIYTDSTNGKFVTADRGFIERKKREYLEEKAAAFVDEMRQAGIGSEEAIEKLREAFRGEGKERR